MGLFTCISASIPRLSLDQYSRYVGLVEKSCSAPLIGEKYGKMVPKNPEGGHCQTILCLRGSLTFPLILIN
jgi:hypothetical protein